jgi:hypothetical protein
MKNLLNLLKEIKIDKNINHLSKLKSVISTTQTYQFEINNIKYIIDFVLEKINNETILNVAFRNLTSIEKLKSKTNISVDQYYSELDQAKFGLTKTGSSMLVLNEIYNVIGKYIENKTPTYFKFEAVEDNRKKLYITLIKKAEKEIGINFERIFFDPANNTHLTNTSQIFVYKINYED